MTVSAATAPAWSAGTLRPVLPGLFLAVLTLLFGFGLGVVFGLNEDIIKSRLNASADAVSAGVYADAAAKKAVVDKSWNYMQRAHLHAGSLGVVAVALSMVVVLIGTGPRVSRAVSVGLGAGSLGYSVYWLLAGFRAPGLGSTTAAKKSLELLAVPSSGLVVACTATVAVLVVMAMRRRDHDV